MAGNNPIEMTDLVYELHGDAVPLDYPAAIWSALVERLPWLAGEAGAGIHPLRTVSGDQRRALLSRRSRLVLRLPRARAAEAAALPDRAITLADETVTVGEARERPITPWPTLNALFVASGSANEADFETEMRAAIAELGPRVRLICGRRQTRALGEQTVNGASIVLHDLDPDTSLNLQYSGLGPLRQYGCGIFVPHKIISGIY